MSPSPDHRLPESDPLERVELRAAYLIDRYSALRGEVSRLRSETAQLRQALSESQARADELERKLAFAGPVTREDPDVQRSARDLYSEIDDLVDTVDDVLHLLEIRVK